MRKSTVIAQCLVNSNMVPTIEAAGRAVRVTFEEEFAAHDFAEWNQNLDDTAAGNIMRAVDRASRINVRKFILDLW